MAASVVSWEAVMGNETREGKSQELWSGVGGKEKSCKSPTSPHSVRSLGGAVGREGLQGTKKGEVLSPGCVGTERGMKRFTEAGMYLDARWPTHIRKHLSSSGNEEPRSRAG